MLVFAFKGYFFVCFWILVWKKRSSGIIFNPCFHWQTWRPFHWIYLMLIESWMADLIETIQFSGALKWEIKTQQGHYTAALYMKIKGAVCDLKVSRVKNTRQCNVTILSWRAACFPGFSQTGLSIIHGLFMLLSRGRNYTQTAGEVTTTRWTRPPRKSGGCFTPTRHSPGRHRSEHDVCPACQVRRRRVNTDREAHPRQAQASQYSCLWSECQIRPLWSHKFLAERHNRRHETTSRSNNVNK